MRHLVWILWLLGLLASCSLRAQAQDAPGLFDGDPDEVLELIVKSDFVALLADRSGDADELLAVIDYPSTDGQMVEVPLKIEVRGRFRRDPMVCDFPPIRLDFDKDMDLPPPFQGQNKLKVVTHCQDEALIFREYYLYRVFRMLTDTSFRVRLCRIRYEDINGARETEEKYAFIIESVDQLAERLGGEEVDDDVKLSNDDVARDHLTLVHMFNYMAANRDFGVRVRQNVKVISQPDGDPLVVPYDFDWSGMVNAEYTKSRTQEGKPVYKSRVRFKRLCRSEEEYQAVIERFQALKKDIFAMYKSSEHLPLQAIRETLGYYKTFYRNVGKQKTMDKVFRKECAEQAAREQRQDDH